MLIASGIEATTLDDQCGRLSVRVRSLDAYLEAIVITASEQSDELTVKKLI